MKIGANPWGKYGQTQTPHHLQLILKSITFLFFTDGVGVLFCFAWNWAKLFWHWTLASNDVFARTRLKTEKWTG